MSDASANQPKPAGTPVWIWGAAVAVLVVALAGGGYWWLGMSHKTSVAAKRPNLIGDLGGTVTALDTVAPDQDKICPITLTRALDFGVVPPGATLVSNDAQAGQPEGRYTCQVQGSDGKYTMTIDLTCPGSQDKTCYALDTVQRDDGTTLYKRQS